MKKKISPRPLIRAGLALALGLNLLSVSVPQLLGSGIYENQKIVLQKDGITVAPTGTVVFADTFETNTAWDPEKVNNYQDLLKITFGSEFQGQKCLMISGREIDRKIDTAWGSVGIRAFLPDLRRNAAQGKRKCRRNVALAHSVARYRRERVRPNGDSVWCLTR